MSNCDPFIPSFEPDELDAALFAHAPLIDSFHGGQEGDGRDNCQLRS
jgi:hypothetical protein